ncbi:MAG: flagellar motor switch protein FliN [candidate division Zixibacteria bacterium CG_4_9_14_3_um_filter_46_8]|nr:MAG: flagellar motor switch protein FliN [candidate division Zixibacteria bacterium CG_4_9_14_3_um_filter_46_8]
MSIDPGNDQNNQLSREEMDKLIEKQMQESLDADDSAGAVKADSIGPNQPSIEMPKVIQKAEFPQFGAGTNEASNQNIGLLMDVPLPVSIELGRTTMTIEDILNLGPGSIVELDKLAGEPVDLLVNYRMIAKGEVVVVDENFGIRITDLISKQNHSG